MSKYNITEDESLLAEKYWFEYNGLLTLITQFTSNSEFKPDIERYKIVLLEYMEAFASYSLLTRTLSKKYAQDGDDRESFSINFEERTITFNENGGCQSCK